MKSFKILFAFYLITSICVVIGAPGGEESDENKFDHSESDEDVQGIFLKICLRLNLSLRFCHL